MSDAACEGGEVEMCCYMNRCVPSSNIGCRSSRIDFFRMLQSHDEECEMQKLAEQMRAVSENVRECDDQGIHCIDYVTELMTDPGAFDRLNSEGAEFREV